MTNVDLHLFKTRRGGWRARAEWGTGERLYGPTCATPTEAVRLVVALLDPDGAEADERERRATEN